MPAPTRTLSRRAALLAALAVHAVLVLVRLHGTAPDTRRAPNFLQPIVPFSDRAVVPLIFYTPRDLRRTERTPGPPRPRPTEVRETEAEVAAVVVPEELVLPRPVEEEETPPRIAPRGGFGGLRPSLGSGVLWVRPLPLPPAELALRLRGKSNVELLDSTVHVIVQQYLDSLANDPSLRTLAPPAWVGKIGGKEFGLDGRNIIVAGLRIPAAILGFLPLSLNGGGNIDQNRAARRIRDLRADLIQAGQRADNFAEFKRSIRDIRERKQAERDFERNQRTVPVLPDSGATTQ